MASSNCTEIGVMGINNEGQWYCWMLETRPELPYRLDKQMYPIGMSLDLSSQMQIKQCKYFKYYCCDNLKCTGSRWSMS